MIPKTFHYIWLGDKPFPVELKKYFDANKALHPDYEFRLWTNDYINMNNAYQAAAYRCKEWAFLSDYIRFEILLEYGGIYLDTDMEVLKKFDSLLESQGFVGVDKTEEFLYCGVIGMTKNNPLIRRVLSKYNELGYNKARTSPMMLTSVFKEKVPNEIDVYSYEYFYPLEDGEQGELKEISYATHHWSESWRSFVGLRKVLRKLKVIKIIHMFRSKNESLSRYINIK